MRNWRQALTNKIRSRKVGNKCSENSLKHTKSNCESVAVQTYKFEHKLSPKCATPNELSGKSVFFALRRVLKCAPIVKAQMTAKTTIKPTTMKPELRAKKVAIKKKYNDYLKKKQQNTLEYQLFHKRNYGNVQILNDNNDVDRDNEIL
jgi:hypothetical protein